MGASVSNNLEIFTWLISIAVIQLLFKLGSRKPVSSRRVCHTPNHDNVSQLAAMCKLIIIRDVHHQANYNQRIMRGADHCSPKVDATVDNNVSVIGNVSQ